MDKDETKIKDETKTTKEIDWDEVDKECEKWLELTKIFEENVKKSRQKPVTAEEWEKQQETVLKYLEEHGLKDNIVELDENDNQFKMVSFDDLSVEDFINDIEENNTNKNEKK